jgi:hypothetical protein
VNILLFTLLAALLYLVADWILQRIELAAGRRLEHRSLVFFTILLTLALTSFSLIENLTGSA